MTTHSHIKSNIHTKTSFDGGGGSHTHSMPSNTHGGRDKLFMADIAFVYRKGGHLDMIKSRYDLPQNDITLEYATGVFSKILSGIAFQDNDLIMFKEGLKQQIESAIEIAIKTFHESR